MIKNIIIAMTAITLTLNASEQTEKSIMDITQPNKSTIELSDTVWTETVHGFGMYTQRKDGCVSEHIRLYKNWQPEIVNILKHITQPHHTILHLGGHIGFDDILLGRILENHGKLFVFEPNPEVFQILQQNIKYHALNTTCTLFSKAASNETGTCILSFEYGNTGHATIIPGWEHMSESTSVELVKIDDILHDVEKIDLIFMDIEGAEIKALQGANQLLARSGCPDILMEWDIEMMSGCGSNIDKFCNQMFESSRNSYFIFQRDDKTIIEKVNKERLMSAPHIDVLWTSKDFGDSEFVIES